MSGHCVGTSRAVNFFPSCIKCNFFHHTPGSSSYFPSGVRIYSSFLFPHLSL
jgi:hypothetical protein